MIIMIIMIMTMKTSVTFHAGAAKATALMVKLGLLGLVRDIVAKLSQQGRADVVSQVNQASLLHFTAGLGRCCQPGGPVSPACCTVAALQSPDCFQPPSTLRACPG